MEQNRKIGHYIHVLAPWALAAYWLVLITATHVPVPEGPPGSDKVLHLGAYFVLAVLLATTLYTRGVQSRRLIVITIVALFAFGVFDEVTQTLVNRVCDPLDALADWCGVLAGLGAFFGLRKLAE